MKLIERIDEWIKKKAVVGTLKVTINLRTSPEIAAWMREKKAQYDREGGGE